MARLMLNKKGFPNMFQAEVIYTIVYLLNKCPLKVLMNKTPIKAW